MSDALVSIPTNYGSGGAHLNPQVGKKIIDQLRKFKVLALSSGAGITQGVLGTLTVQDGTGNTLKYDARIAGQHGNQLYVKTKRRAVGDAAAKAFDLDVFYTSASLGTFTAANATETFTTAAAHGLTTGAPVRLTNSGGALPTGVDGVTVYFAIVLTATTLKLASTEANAFAGTAVAISDDGTGTHTMHQMGVEKYPACSMLDTNARFVETVVNGVSEYITVTDQDSGNNEDRPVDAGPTPLASGAQEVALAGVVRKDNVAAVYNVTDAAMEVAADFKVADAGKVVCMTSGGVAASKELLVFVFGQ
jgi:hypothetical protein